MMISAYEMVRGRKGLTAIKHGDEGRYSAHTLGGAHKSVLVRERDGHVPLCGTGRTHSMLEICSVRRPPPSSVCVATVLPAGGHKCDCECVRDSEK